MWLWLARLFGFDGAPRRKVGRKSVENLASLLKASVEELRAVAAPTNRKRYRWFAIRKRSGGRRILREPIPELKDMQRRLLRKVFAKLKVHPAAVGFVRGKSIVDHAKLHVGKKTILKVDVKDFFGSTDYWRLKRFYERLGWRGIGLGSHTPQHLLMCLTYYKGLPQGAPTSPILSNAINYKMDCRLAALAEKSKAAYSRYADDIVFSFDIDDVRFVRGVLRRIRRILHETGYHINYAKLRVLRSHQSQQIAGLVVNEKVQLPRKTRRLLRAVEHRLQNLRPATMTRRELDGWRAYERMVKKQARS